MALDLYQPDPGETGWADEVNKNFQDIEDEVNGVAFGSWSAKSFGTIYQAATDGFVVAEINCDTNGDRGYLLAYTEGDSDPQELRASASVHDWTGSDTRVPRASLMMPVRSGHYWKVTKTDTAGACAGTVYWLPARS